MKNILLLIFSFALLGCITDVSDVSDMEPHRNLIQTVWELKTDAYVIEYEDQRGLFCLIPCSPNLNSSYFPNWDYRFDKGRIGQSYNGKTVVGGLRTGDQIKVVRVLESRNPELGTIYYPMVVPVEGNQWTGSRELAAEIYYSNFYSSGVLNPQYAVQVIREL